MPNGTTEWLKQENPTVGQRGNVMTSIQKLRHLGVCFGTWCIVFTATLQFAVFWNNLSLILIYASSPIQWLWQILFYYSCFSIIEKFSVHKNICSWTVYYQNIY